MDMYMAYALNNALGRMTSDRPKKTPQFLGLIDADSTWAASSLHAFKLKLPTSTLLT